MYSFQPNEQVPYWPQESSRHYGDGSTSERSSAAHLESIHARLTQLTQRRTAILATRNHQLANRQREDIDFHRVAQSLEAEEFVSPLDFIPRRLASKLFCLLEPSEFLGAISKGLIEVSRS